MEFRRVKDYVSWLYYQYQIISCCAVLEPWERSMFNTILLTIFAMVVYTAYVFIPIHIRLAWEFFSKICCYHSTVSNWSYLYLLIDIITVYIYDLQFIDLVEYCIFFITGLVNFSTHSYPAFNFRLMSLLAVFTCYIVYHSTDYNMLPHIPYSQNSNLWL